MRIVRGHDYYDSALAYGRDDDIMFVREPKFFAQRECPLHAHSMEDIFLQGVGRWGYKHYTNEVIMRDRGIDYKYPMYSTTVYIGTKRFAGYRCDIRGEAHTFWQLEPFLNWVKSINHEIPDSKMHNGISMTLEEYFTPRETTDKELEWMIENKVATALYSNDVRTGFKKEELGGWDWDTHHDWPWRCNAADPGNALKEYGVMKALDPYSTFQELSMFVGGIMGGNSPDMVKITDEKTLVKKHGFDKWSFRKMPESK